MKKGIKEILELQGYGNLQKRILISLVILIITIVTLILIIFFYSPKECQDNACFSNAIANCKRVSWVREDTKASWYYEIIGNSGDKACKVKIKLIKMNQGTIDIEELQGLEMTCIAQKSDTRFPEENMNKCSGVLKEKLQEIIIERMHNYILKNLGEIKESFGV